MFKAFYFLANTATGAGVRTEMGEFQPEKHETNEDSRRGFSIGMSVDIILKLKSRSGGL